MNLLESLTVALLKRIKPGFLPEPLFNEMQRINHCVAVELLFIKNGKILLEKRPPNDRFWPNMYHIPGTMVKGNEDVEQALRRLLYQNLEEYEGNLEVTVNRCYDWNTKRGRIFHILFTVYGEVSPRGKLFSMKKLPLNIIDYHKTLIEGLK